MNLVSAPAHTPLSMFAQPILATLRHPLNPFAYLPSTWALVASIKRATKPRPLPAAAAPESTNMAVLAAMAVESPVAPFPAAVAPAKSAKKLTAPRVSKPPRAAKGIAKKSATGSRMEAPALAVSVEAPAVAAESIRMATAFTDSIQPAVTGLQ